MAGQQGGDGGEVRETLPAACRGQAEGEAEKRHTGEGDRETQSRARDPMFGDRETAGEGTKGVGS